MSKQLTIESRYSGLSESELIDGCNQFGSMATSSISDALVHFKTAGDMLNEMRSRIEHGHWLPWLEANWKHSQQWASTAMRISNYTSERNLSDVELRKIGSAGKVLALIQEQSKATRKQSAEADESDAEETPATPEAESKPVEPREQKPSSNPRSDAAPRNSKPAAPEFDLGSSLDEHRSAILEMAGDYAAAKQTKHFIVMLRKVAADLEVTTP
jgi:hypothetical protein